MSLEVYGKVIAKPASESGLSQKGQWKKAYLVIRYEEGQYPKDIMLSNMRKADAFERIPTGVMGTFKFDSRVRTGSNNKWYQDLECWSWSIDPNYVADPI